MYIDPGAGSLAFQLLISAIVGAGFTFRRAVMNLFRFGRHRDDSAKPPEDEGTTPR